MNKLIIDPVRYYEINGEVCSVKAIPSGTGTIANNQLVVAAVTGKCLRFMGYIGQSSGATVATLNFRDGSGGTIKTGYQVLPPTTAGATFALPVIDSGYFSTTVSTGLYMDVGGAPVNLTVFYLEYTP